ncbi:MAG: GNAT family acetyltransferase [Hyphomonas sp.]|uniref:GNAT family acetyltransferase n=1 Tax=Hyphomonas sp. TaxID=87 RepID=UPI00326718C5
MALHIRDFREADRAALIALWETCALTRPWNDPNADLDRAITSRDAAILIGTWNDQVVASIMVGHDGHRGWIYYLAVSLDRQTRGHGREMMAEAELWLKARGAPKVQLMVRQDNETATEFYSALGYERQDVTVFGKWLTSSAEAD